MPKFPRYESQRDLTTQQPSFLAPESTSGQQTELIGGVFQKTQDAVLTIAKGVADAQKQTATRNYELQEAELLNRMLQDPNPDYDKYSSELNQFAVNNTKGVSPLEKQKLTLELSHKANLAKIKVRNQIYKHAVDTGRAAVLDRLENFSKSGDVSGIRGLVSEQAGSNLFSREDLFKLGDSYSSKAKQNQFISDLEADPSLADKNLSRNVYDFDINEMEKARNIQDKYVKDYRINRSNGLIEKFAVGDVTLEDIEIEESIPEKHGGIPRNQLLSYKNAVKNGISNDLNDMLREKTPYSDPTKRSKSVQKYDELIEKFIDSESDQWKAKELLAEAYKDGIINKEEQKFLNDLKNNLTAIEFNRSTGPIATVIRGLKDFLKFQSNETDDQIASKVKRLVSGISMGEKPDVVLRQIMADEIKAKFPDIASYPKTGKLKQDSNGMLFRVYPDGTWEPEAKLRAS